MYSVYDPWTRRLYIYARDPVDALAQARSAIRKGWFAKDLTALILSAEQASLIIRGRNLRLWIAGRRSNSTASLIRQEHRDAAPQASPVPDRSVVQRSE